MLFRRLAAILGLLSVLLLAGCAGGNDPVNAGKDMPVQPKKDKEKDK